MSSVIHALEVVHVEPLAPQIIQLLLKPEQPIDYHSGQYVMLGFNAEELKPFSIASAPREDGLIECHIRNQADSEWMQALFSVKQGDTLVMEEPKAQMQLQTEHKSIIFVAGGTGFAPMKALLETLLKQQTNTPIHFYWGARSVEDLYQHSDLLSLAKKYPNIRYTPVISDDAANWKGLTGLVHEQVLKDYPDLTEHTLYMCGPWPMVQQAKQDFFKAGLSESDCIC
ncbi:MAG: NAD(P)H-flavin reductase [Gammaproteobacteria bacterium]|nr:NAD(P)H-flavin reductase [Gammaproteobacteria bacterium]